MIKIVFVLTFAVTFFASLSLCWAFDNLKETVAIGCDKELSTYCSEITPGKGRKIACLYANSDKLSGQCEYALYDVALQLEMYVSRISHIASECKVDINNFCSKVTIGEGHLLKCLDENASKISPQCTEALQEGEK